VTSDRKVDGPLPCLKCGRKVGRAFPPSVTGEDDVQPYRATMFTTHGHYGSTVFDEMNGTYLLIDVCDRCLVTAAIDGLVLLVEPGCELRPPVKLTVWDPPLGDGME
jgi:hypothetical protein